MHQLYRLESKPQGAVFTGTVEPELSVVWSLYRTDSGRSVWHAIMSDGRDSWWEEANAKATVM